MGFRVSVALAIAIGCTSGDDAVTLGDGSGDPVENPNTDCSGAETFRIGVSHGSSASAATVAVSAAAPTPPDVGDNAWSIAVTDDAGAPVSGLSVEVTPWMPLHNHGLTPPAYLGTETDPGTYTIETFDLIMPGLWQFTVDLAPDGDPDTAVFLFCAEG